MSIPPVDVTLFEVLSDAVKTGLEIAKNRRQAGEFIPRHSGWLKLGWFPSGMPYFADVNGPLNYSPLFAGGFASILSPGKKQDHYSDEDSFKKYENYVSKVPQINERIGVQDAEMSRSFRRVLLGQLVERYIYLNDSADFNSSKFLPIYREVETFLFNEVLPVTLVVPILRLTFESKSVEIDSNTSLIRMDDDLQLARMHDVDFAYTGSRLVRSPATHAFVRSNLAIKNDNLFVIDRAIQKMEAEIIDDIDLLFAALRVVTGFQTGYAQLLSVPVGWATGYNARLKPLFRNTAQNYPPEFGIGRMKTAPPHVSQENSEKAAKLYLKLRDPKLSKLLIAARRLNRSSTRENSDDSLVDAIIGLESLLSDNSQELTYKISIRSAHLLRKDNPSPVKVFEDIKKLYSLRSKIVHGSKHDADTIFSVENSDVAATDAALFYLRKIVWLLAENPKYLEAKTIDQEMLESIHDPPQPEEPTS